MSHKVMSTRWKRRIICYGRLPTPGPKLQEQQMTPPGQTEPNPPLDFNAQVALGKGLTPQAAWEQVKVLVQQALEYQPNESQQIADRLNLPIDTTNLTEVLELMNPVKGINEFHYINPKMDLRNLMKQDPVKVFEGVVRILTVSDRYAALK
jgi:hypothetical protein